MEKYEDLVEKALELNGLNYDVASQAQTLATLAIADRLDRLCKIMSRDMRQ